MPSSGGWTTNALPAETEPEILAVSTTPVPRGPAAEADSVPFASLADANPSSALSPGTFIGEYEVEALIGKGGMGSVYRAVQPVIGKKVAIKVLAGGLAKDDVAIQRFILEARSVNEIGHRNLVDIFSFGQLKDGRYYYVMEYLEGESLGALLQKKGRLSPKEAFPIFVDVGRALEATHGKGIVHRDLKPDNVILIRDSSGGMPRAKLLDFGLAKLVAEREAAVMQTPKTGVGFTVGTPRYMAPEQCRAKTIDARTDIWALGVMLYETLTGKLPFAGSTPMEIWQAQMEKTPPRLSRVCPDIVNPGLEALILRMLAKNPDERLPSAAEFVRSLVSLMATERSPSASHSEVTLPRRPVIPAAAATDKPSPKAIENLRATLGLRIDVPAYESQDPSQLAAINIDLTQPRATRPQAADAGPRPRRTFLVAGALLVALAAAAAAIIGH
jgi:serine/threonine-protein kinase